MIETAIVLISIYGNPLSLKDRGQEVANYRVIKLSCSTNSGT